jgi:CheY-like chemotaxis protein
MTTGYRILVVDDDRAFRLSTAALLRNDGHAVDVVAIGQEAVVTLRASRYDLLLLDLRMPGIDGLGVVDALRARGAQRDGLSCSPFAIRLLREFD